MQAVVVRITSHQPITICSIYPTLKQLTDHQDQLPKPLLIVGDSTPTVPCGTVKKPPINHRGNKVEDMLTKYSPTFPQHSDQDFMAELRRLDSVNEAEAKTSKCTADKDTKATKKYDYFTEVTKII